MKESECRAKDTALPRVGKGVPAGACPPGRAGQRAPARRVGWASGRLPAG